MFDAFFSRHQRIALQFSSGKDSAACLYLLAPYWDRLTVAWMNPGNPTQEVREYMEGIRKLVPNFLEVVGEQPKWVREHGYPADVLPYEATDLCGASEPGRSVKFSTTFACCSANMWMPMLAAMRSGGFTGIIRGQKLADSLKSPLRSGDVVDGVEYLLPLEFWDDTQVFEFLGPRVPKSYLRGLPTSLDCANCTGYTSSHSKWWKDLERTAPKSASEVTAVHKQQKQLLEAYLKTLGV